MTETDRRLQQIEAIKELKYTYLRCLDLNRCDELADCLAENVVCWYHSGRHQ